MALRKDPLESTDWGRLCSTFDAAATAIAPVSSATRSLAEDTAGADAPLKKPGPGVVPVRILRFVGRSADVEICLLADCFGRC